MRIFTYVLAGGLFAVVSYMAIQHSCHESSGINVPNEAQVASVNQKSSSPAEATAAPEPAAATPSTGHAEAVARPEDAESRIAVAPPASPAAPPPPAAPAIAPPAIEIKVHRDESSRAAEVMRSPELVPPDTAQEVASEAPEPASEEPIASAPAPAAAPSKPRSAAPPPVHASAPGHDILAAAPSKPRSTAPAEALAPLPATPPPVHAPTSAKGAINDEEEDEEERSTGLASVVVNGKPLLVTYPAQPLTSLSELATDPLLLTLTEGKLVVSGKTLPSGKYFLRLRSVAKGGWAFALSQTDGESALAEIPMQRATFPDVGLGSAVFKRKPVDRKEKLHVSLVPETEGKIVISIRLGRESYTGIMEVR